MNTTLLTVTCLLFGLAAPLAGAEGIPVGARLGPVEICYEVLGPDLVEEGCEAPCSIHPQWCGRDLAVADGILDTVAA